MGDAETTSWAKEVTRLSQALATEREQTAALRGKVAELEACRDDDALKANLATERQARERAEEHWEYAAAAVQLGQETIAMLKARAEAAEDECERLRGERERAGECGECLNYLRPAPDDCTCHGTGRESEE